MKIIVFSDLHAHTFKRFSKVGTGENSRLRIAIDVLKYIRQVAMERGILDVVFAGDLFDAKNRTPIVAVNAVFREFLRWSQSGMNVLLIPGNHDFALRSGKEHALEVLSSLDGFLVVDEPLKAFWELANDDRIFVHTVPYREELSEEWFRIEHEARYSLCLTHGVAEGCAFRPGIVHDDKVKVIPREWLRKFSLSVIGDVHYPQWLERNILVPGCPWWQHPFESPQERGFWIVDLETMEHELIPVPNIPRFVEIQMNADGSWESESEVENHVILLRPENIGVQDWILQATKEELHDEFGAELVEVLAANIVSVDDLGFSPRLQIDPQWNPVRVLSEVLGSDLVDLHGEPESDLKRLGIEVLKVAQERVG